MRTSTCSYLIFLTVDPTFFLRTVEKHNGKVLNRHERHDERDCRTSETQGKVTLFFLPVAVNPLSPNIDKQILQTDLYTFPYRISWEKLIKDQRFFSL